MVTASYVFRNNQKVLREMQTLLDGCRKAEPKFFAPPQTPSRGCRMDKIKDVSRPLIIP